MPIDRQGNEKAERQKHDPQCAYETGEDRCRMAAGATTGGRGYCSWHDQSMRGPGKGHQSFSEWINGVRATYGFSGVSVVWCKYSVQSLWDAVRGRPGQLHVDPQWSAANDITFTRPLTDESTEDYKALWGKMRKLSPAEWRVEIAKLNEKHGVEMGIAPLAEGDGEDVFIPISLEEDRGQTEAEASEERQRQQAEARQLGLIDEVPF